LKAILMVSLLVFVVAGSGSGIARAAKTADTLTGFGATVAHWNQHHSADHKFVKNAAYNWGPGLGDHGGPGDRYFGVTVISGRMESYNLRLVPGTGIATAKREVLVTEFPPDAKITWFKNKDTCAQMLVHSKILERTIHAFALVEFSSGDAADHYTPSDASQLVVTSATGNATGFDC
jgi:hypothetical protein